MYEALRAYFLEGRASHEVARAFGYSPGSFRVLCHQFRRDPDPQFFASPTPGPRTQPKKSPARDLAVALRKQNHSVYEIAEALKAKQLALSPTAVREVLRAEGFAALPRRLDEERSGGPGPTREPVADVRGFGLVPQTEFVTRCGGLFLFVPDLVRLQPAGLARAGKLPGSVMIPAEHALRAALALKLWSIERKSHVMTLVTDPGLTLFCGLNAMPKKSYLSEYTSRLGHAHTTRLLGAWHKALVQDKLFAADSFNLDFHSVPYYGEDPQVQSHYVSMRSRSQPSVLAFLAQDAQGRAFLLLQCGLAQGRRGRGDLSLHRLLEEASRSQSSPLGVRFAVDYLPPARPSGSLGHPVHHAAAPLPGPAARDRAVARLGLAARAPGGARAQVQDPARVRAAGAAGRGAPAPAVRAGLGP